MSDENKIEETKPAPPSAFVTRKNFIQLGLAAIGAAWAGTFIQSRLFPAEPAIQEAELVEIPLSELPEGGVKHITYGGVESIVIRTRESIKAFSLVCTHLACLVEWQETENEFYCPCHDGRFNPLNGAVISGPPPRPLPLYAFDVVEG